MKILVNKFGGDIVKNYLNEGISHLKTQIKKGYKIVLVISAIKNITNLLVELIETNKISTIQKIEKIHREFIKTWKLEDRTILNFLSSEFQELKLKVQIINKYEKLPSVKSEILSFGEKIASFLVFKILEKNKICCDFVPISNIGIVTNSNFQNADINFEKSLKNIKKFKNNLKYIDVLVVPGFIGITKKKKITTLGRGGSDTTACIFGVALSAEKIILFKSVKGILSSDPKIVKCVKPVKFLNYDEAEEAGKVLHFKTTKILRKKPIKLEVAYIKNPKIKTIILNSIHQKPNIKIVNLMKNLFLFKFKSEKIEEYGFLYKIAKIFYENKINMVLIRNTKESLYIVIETKNFNKKIFKKLEKINGKINLESVEMIYAIGKLNENFINKFNKILETQAESIIGAFPYKNSTRIEAIVKKDYGEKILKILHKQLIK